MIEFDRDTAVLIDHPFMQRLRQISQLGLTQFTYPNATHTRFDHSIGVYHVTSLLLDEVRKNEERFTEEGEAEGTKHLRPEKSSKLESAIVKHAALLHDIGHGPFSHVSEKLFDERLESDVCKLTIGPVPISMVLYYFRKHYLFGDAKDVETGKAAELAASGQKKLSEILAAIFLISDRFMEFYKRNISANNNYQNVADPVNIACLILGDPIREDDFALPELIHGVVDSDKLDYMVRDARTCGISVSIDTSRAILGAGFYRVENENDPLAKKSEPVDGNKKVFVIDKFGGDTFEQVGLSRQSLFSRVYHHPVTRNMEMVFSKYVSTIRTTHNVKRRRIEYLDLLQLWTKNQFQILNEGIVERGCEKARELARALAWRRLPKRAVVISWSTVLSLFPSRWERQLNEVAASSFKRRKQAFVANELGNYVQSILETKEFLSLVEEAFNVVDHGTGNSGSVSEDEIHFLPQANLEESLMGTTRIIDRANNGLVRSDTILPSYLDAGIIPQSAAYVLSSIKLREAVAVAVSKLCTDHSFRNVQKNLRGEVEVLEWSNAKWLNIPVFDWYSQQNHCKVSENSIIEILLRMHEAHPDDPCYWLQYPSVVNVAHKEIGEKFSQYGGSDEWRVEAASVAAYLQQFPIHLREGVQKLLLDDLEFIGRSKIVAKLEMCLPKLKLRGDVERILLAPLTATSGHAALSFMKGHDFSGAAGRPAIIHNSLTDAINLRVSGDAIVLFDDHSASGKQASKQLRSYFGEYFPDEINIFHSSLPPPLQQALRAIPLYCAFAYIGDDGERAIQKAADELKLNFGGVAGGAKLSEVSSARSLGDELRSFMTKVGTGTMLNRTMECLGVGSCSDWGGEVEKAKANALGYDNYEGTLITALNVPTSTYTALWRPGLYDPSGKYEREMDVCVPWVPLFLRTTQRRRVILY